MERYFFIDESIGWFLNRYQKFEKEEDFYDSLKFDYECAKDERDEFDETLDEIIEEFKRYENYEYSCNGFRYLKLTTCTLAEWEYDFDLDENKLTII